MCSKLQARLLEEAEMTMLSSARHLIRHGVFTNLWNFYNFLWNYYPYICCTPIFVIQIENVDLWVYLRKKFNSYFVLNYQLQTRWFKYCNNKLNLKIIGLVWWYCFKIQMCTHASINSQHQCHMQNLYCIQIAIFRNC